VIQLCLKQLRLRRGNALVDLLGFGDDFLAQAAVWIGERKPFDVLGDESATPGVELVVEPMIVELLNECRVADREGEPQQI